MVIQLYIGLQPYHIIHIQVFKLGSHIYIINCIINSVKKLVVPNWNFFVVDTNQNILLHSCSFAIKEPSGN